MATESIQDIKRRIKSVTSTERITNSMKLVSAGKLRKAKALFEKTNENSRFITDTIGELFSAGTDVPQEYLEGHSGASKTLYVVITSGRGLCGGFNTNVIKAAQNRIDANDKKKPILVTIGGKGKEYFEKRQYSIHSSYLAPPESVSFLEIKELLNPILEMYIKGEVDKIVLVYTRFKSSLEQAVAVETLLPFEVTEAQQAAINKDATVKFVDYEPNPVEVFNYLIPKYVEMKLYSAVIESATCEHAARRMAMENATDNAREMLDDLNLNYNRARQSAITDEIIEIVAGSEAQN